VILRRLPSAEQFLQIAGAFLAAREAEHNLMLGLAGRLVAEPARHGHEPYLAVVTEDETVVGAFLRTPPHNLVLSELDDPAVVDLVAADLLEVDPSLTGVLGPKVAAARFASAWRQLGGATSRVAMGERIYRADRTRAPAGVPGRMRAYEPGDRETTLRWLGEFAEEALVPGGPPLEAEDWLEGRLREPEGGVVIWEGTSPVSVAGFGNPTPTGIRIGPVYTPPELRRRGYATALVAALTEVLLRGGRRYCFLFTDLANPTSNSIYQRIGYTPVTDVDMWVFG